VNNVGALFALRRESAEGFEMTLALNHVGPFLLTTLLLDTIRASAPARIVNVSSDAHEMVKAFDFDDPQARSHRTYGRSELVSLLFGMLAPRAHPGLRQYAQSKLANVLFTYELARRLEGTGVSVNAVHPGFVDSSFSKGNGAYGWFMRRWAALFAIDAVEGARAPLYVATSPDVEHVTGRYFSKCRLAESSPASKDPTAARRLWEMTERWTESPEAARR